VQNWPKVGNYFKRVHFMGKVELLENASKRYENQSKFKKKYTKFKLKDCST